MMRLNNGSPLRVGGGVSTEDVGMAADPLQDDDGPQHLKQVSRIKHLILQKYLPSVILHTSCKRGSSSSRNDIRLFRCLSTRGRAPELKWAS